MNLHIASQQKTACIVGSMNCMPSHYACMLSKRGWRVVHYAHLNDKSPLTNPVLSGLVDPANTDIKLYSIGRHPVCYLLPRLFRRRLIRDMCGADLVMLSGAAIRLSTLAHRMNGRAVVALGYGDDITLLADKNWPLKRFARLSLFQKLAYGWLLYLFHCYIVHAQLRGLRSCTHIAYFSEGRDLTADNVLTRICDGRTVIRLPRHSISLSGLPALCQTQISTSASRYKVLFPVRFSSEDTMSFDKGWRVFVDGALLFLSSIGDRSDIHFYCFKKGDCWMEAQRIIQANSFSGKFSFLDQCPFPVLYSMMAESTVVVDQLGNHVIGQGLWAAYLGKPVIVNLNSCSDRANFSGSMVLSASTAEEFAHQLSIALRPVSMELAKNINPLRVSRYYSLEAEYDSWMLFD